MTHDIDMFKPRLGEKYNHIDATPTALDHPRTFISAGLATVTTIFGPFFFFVPPAVPIVGILMLSITVACIMTGFVLPLTHVEAGMRRGERVLWRKYKELDDVARAEISLTTDDIIEARTLGIMHDLSAKVEALHEKQKNRKLEEARHGTGLFEKMRAIEHTTDVEIEIASRMKELTKE